MNVRAYYNEIDPFAAQWLRNLIAAGHIAPGDVDERSIIDVQPDDLRGYTQAHFFAGIGGWSFALRLAGWLDDRAVWTGSCPCPPFSSAARGRRAGFDDPRDLWPKWRALIASRAPCVVFGEQVAHGSAWIDRASADLEALDYEIGAAVLPAIGVGKDHTRPRVYFVGHSDSYGQSSLPVDAQMARLQRNRSNTASVVSSNGVSSRMATFSAFGNAIVPQVAAAFVQAADEAMSMQRRSRAETER